MPLRTHSLRIRVRRRFAIAAVAAAAVVALTGCGTAAGSPGTSTSTAAVSAAPSSAAALQTVTPGKFTVATGQPAYSPWVQDDKPQSGKGFEAAVAYAVAKQLGYAAADVVWTRTTFDSAIAPGPKTFDVNLQQFSVTPQRKKAVDFSSPYYTTDQAIVTTKGSPAASATTLAALKKITIGVAAGSTSYSVVNSQVGVQPKVFNSNDDAVLALKSGQVQALALDLPTAFYLAQSELKNGVVSGQFAGSAGGDKFAFVLQKGSPLTKPVSAAVDAIAKDGTLAAITKQWLSTAVDAPVFK
ncbi:ABC transporter substrate-binding protein [uncultured Amnibacterium sp.]|uniref:ABC transporter substrate-binding protein n=1 Tax=uncultured Amnibacterium sp. TaxID=1631851 RepID=UPI0035CA1442